MEKFIKKTLPLERHNLSIESDNGPEFKNIEFELWTKNQNIVS